MQKTKICHVAASHKRYDRRIFEKECQSLAKAGYDVTLLVADGKESEVINGVKIQSVDLSTGARWLGPGEWIIDGKRKKSKDVSIFNRIQREIYTSKYMLNDAMAVDADIYHIHEPILLRLGAKLKSIGKKVIFDSHENHPAQIRVNKSIPSFLRKLCSSTYYRYETHTTKKFNAVIVPCTVFNGINIFEGRCSKIQIISNAPKLEDFYDIYDQQHGFAKTLEPSVCYVGGLTPQRGIIQLIKAAYKAGVRLNLAGIYSPTGYQEELEKMKEYSCVNYLGYLYPSDLVDVYKNSKIGIATILNIGQYHTGDNFATKVYEYMSMGLPVILSKSQFVEKVFEDYRFGITVDPGNIEEIADAIRRIIEDPTTSKSMGENGRMAIKKLFNWEIEEIKLLNLYQELSSIKEINSCLKS